MRVSTRLITPAIAKDLLARNLGDNRRLREAHVAYLAEQMIQGRWHPTGDAVCLRIGDGMLMNAQHRLHAIIKSGCTIEMIVAEDVTPEAFQNMDRGAMRSIADVTGLGNDLVADAMIIISIMDNTLAARRIAEQRVADVATWWRPAHTLCASHHNAGNTRGVYNAPVRVGFGLRWATASSTRDRSYIRDQWLALVKSDTPRMAKATATLWKRLVQSTQGNSKASNDKVGRLKLLLATYYGMDPDRADVAPLQRADDDIHTEVREWLLQMEDAYLASNKETEHPYLFACWHRGLRPGQKVRVRSPKKDAAATGGQADTGQGEGVQCA